MDTSGIVLPRSPVQGRKMDQTQIDTQLNLAAHYQANQSYDKADEVYETVLESTNNPAIEYQHARLHLEHTFPQKNELKAIRLLENSADKKFAPAMHALAKICTHQQQTNQATAVFSQLKDLADAASENNSEAQLQTGICYFEGSGVEVDHEQARRYLLLAQNSGKEEAERYLDKLSCPNSPQKQSPQKREVWPDQEGLPPPLFNLTAEESPSTLLPQQLWLSQNLLEAQRAAQGNQLTNVTSDENPIKPQSRVVTCKTVKLAGGQEHHYDHYFDFGDGEEIKYDLDLWITSKDKSPASVQEFLTNLNISKQDLTTHIASWNCSISLIKHLANHLMSENSSSIQWKKSSISQNAFHTDGSSKMVMQFLAMIENIELRETDIPSNCPQSLDITRTSKIKQSGDYTESSKCRIRWKTVLKESRQKLKDELLNGVPCPATKEKVKLVDNALMKSEDVGIKMLVKDGFLARDSQQDVRFKKNAANSTAKYKASAEIASNQTTGEKQKKVDFNFGLNHLRFICYMEWRAATELLAVAPKG